MIATNRTYLFWSLLFLGLIAYALPWAQHTTTPLSLGAFDLAEWTSLHPAVRGGSPQLLPTLLLRLPLVLIALAAAASPLSRSLRLLVVLVLAMALLPPFEFFMSDLADPNYRQQFVLAVVTVIAGTVITYVWRGQRTVLIGVILAIGLVSVVGLGLALGHMWDFGLAVQVGPGIMLLILLGILSVTLLLRKQTG